MYIRIFFQNIYHKKYILEVNFQEKKNLQKKLHAWIGLVLYTCTCAFRSILNKAIALCTPFLLGAPQKLLIFPAYPSPPRSPSSSLHFPLHHIAPSCFCNCGINPFPTSIFPYVATTTFSTFGFQIHNYNLIISDWVIHDTFVF